MRKKMKKGGIIALIIVGAFVLSIIITAIACSVIAGRINDSTMPIESLSRWQSYIDDDALIKKIAIPGSHDAGSKGMIWFCETQSRDVADQLACGTRYFDLRVKMKDGECLIYHGPGYGTDLVGILRDVRDFLDNNATEAVILDVHKFGNAEAKTKTVELIDEYFESKLVVNDTAKTDLEFIEQLTLGEVRGKCLLIWGDDDEYVANDNRYFLRNDDHGDVNAGCLQSFYEKNWNWYYSSDKYIKKAIPAYIEKYKQSIGGIFVLQCQLTDGSLIIGPRYREGCHEKNMNAYVTALMLSEDLEYINVIMRDFVSPMKNCYTLTLNLSKGIVKDECRDAYELMISEVVNLTVG